MLLILKSEDRGQKAEDGKLRRLKLGGWEAGMLGG
jgi:hypothetical protein